jgi:hypothetical protein
MDGRSAALVLGGAALGAAAALAWASTRPAAAPAAAAPDASSLQPAPVAAAAASAAPLGQQPPPAAAAASTSAPASAGASAVARFAEDEILAEQFTRNVQFFGAEGQAAVAAAFVVVVGLGGVGSHAAHLLLRSGVGRLRLIDFDQVTLSSLNRHAVATRADVGLPKAAVLAAHFAAILPEARVEPITAMFTADAAEALLAGSPDYVLARARRRPPPAARQQQRNPRSSAGARPRRACRAA